MKINKLKNEMTNVESINDMEIGETEMMSSCLPLVSGWPNSLSILCFYGYRKFD